MLEEEALPFEKLLEEDTRIELLWPKTMHPFSCAALISYQPFPH